MKEKPKFTGLTAVNYDYFISLLGEKMFKLKIIALFRIVERLNDANIGFQGHTIEIQNLKHYMIKCINGY